MSDTRLPVETVLRLGQIDIVGRMTDASNATFAAVATLEDERVPCVYKPQSGERPLWDFPGGTLGHREVASYLLSHALDVGLVPITTWRDDGPAGPGMCQEWIEVHDDILAVNVVDLGDIPSGWHTVITGQGAEGEPVALVHMDNKTLRLLAFFDALINNADRKGGHVLIDQSQRLYAIDHGVTFHVEDKLRTVLWGWIDQPLSADELEVLDRFDALDVAAVLQDHISADEVSALLERAAQLRERGAFPQPPVAWPALPWPPL